MGSDSAPPRPPLASGAEPERASPSTGPSTVGPPFSRPPHLCPFPSSLLLCPLDLHDLRLTFPGPDLSHLPACEPHSTTGSSHTTVSFVVITFSSGFPKGSRPVCSHPFVCSFSEYLPSIHPALDKVTGARDTEESDRHSPPTAFVLGEGHNGTGHKPTRMNEQYNVTCSEDRSAGAGERLEGGQGAAPRRGWAGRASLSK